MRLMRANRRMRGVRIGVLIALLTAAGGAAPLCADPFRFSTQEQQERAKEQALEAQQALATRQLVSVSCQDKLKNRKILQLVAERSSGHWQTRQEDYAPFFDIIDARLRALGLKTYTQQQIKGRIAQAEMDAYFNNDPDAALAASKRLAADYVLRGEIRTTTGINPVVGVKEVAVDVRLTLSSASGRQLSEVSSHSDAFSGHDTLVTATDLLHREADRLVAQLYNDYCRKADEASRSAQ